MGKARVVIAGSAALLVIGIGSASAHSAPSAPQKAVQGCGLAGVGFACTVNIPSVAVGSGAIGVVTNTGTGIAGTIDGKLVNMPGNLTGDLLVGHDGNLLSGALVGSLGNLISGHLEGSLSGLDGHLCGNLNVAGIDVINGGIAHSSGPNGSYSGGGTILGIPGSLKLAPQGGSPIQLMTGGPCG